MKVLVNTPSLKLLGGVANHYLGLRTFWSEKIKYNVIGKRSLKNGSGKYWLPYDLLKYIYKLLVFRPNIVLLNPSLGISALKRDFIFLRIANVLGFKVVVFIHGFNLDVAKSIDAKWISNYLNKTALIFVLANRFKVQLRNWGVHVPIELVTTKVDDKLVSNFKLSKRTGRVSNILFLARVVKEKGIYEAIDTYQILKKQYPQLTFTIVGDGDELPNVRFYVKKHDIKDIIITGALKGEELIETFTKADLYLFLSYGEGMPTSVLEAMAFGLPVITRKVGGLADFFNKKMGFISESYSPENFAEAIIPYIENPDLTRKVSEYNAKYAREHFMASKVALNMESRLKQLL